MYKNIHEQATNEKITIWAGKDVCKYATINAVDVVSSLSRNSYNYLEIFQQQLQ